MDHDRDFWLTITALLIVAVVLSAICDYFGIKVKPLGPDNPLFWSRR